MFSSDTAEVETGALKMSSKLIKTNLSGFLAEKFDMQIMIY